MPDCSNFSVTATKFFISIFTFGSPYNSSDFMLFTIRIHSILSRSHREMPIKLTKKAVLPLSGRAALNFRLMIISAALFRIVHRGIRMLRQALDVIPILWIDTNAYTNRYMKFFLFIVHGFLNPLYTLWSSSVRNHTIA